MRFPLSMIVHNIVPIDNNIVDQQQSRDIKTIFVSFSHNVVNYCYYYYQI